MIVNRRPARAPAASRYSAKNATKILLDSVDYTTVLLTGISGIFVNNLPLSFSTALAHSAKPANAKPPPPGLFRYCFGKNLRNLRKQSTSKNLAFFAGAIAIAHAHAARSPHTPAAARRPAPPHHAALCAARPHHYARGRLPFPSHASVA